MLPQCIKNILWDVDLQVFEAADYKEFMAVRVAEKGDLNCLAWFIAEFGVESLVPVLNSREVTAATKQFWQIYFENFTVSTTAQVLS